MKRDLIARLSLAVLLSLTFAGALAADETPSVLLGIDGPAPPDPPAVVSRDSLGRVTLRAVRLETSLQVDGRLEESIYRAVPPIDGFIQQEPLEGEPATEETEVWVLYDHENLYVSARCWDSHPERMVANEMKRDSPMVEYNQNFAVILDTFYDRRNGFLFHTNPLGALSEAQITDERNINSDWNTVWDVKTGRFSDGWTVEIEIPFKSLRYKEGSSQLWGINFRRIVRWKNEWSYLTPIAAAYRRMGLLKLSSAATLVGVEPPARSLNLELKPYTTAGSRTDLTADEPYSNDLDADVGFDAKYGLTRGLILDFTYNTDFAQVEDDDQQVNLTRFSLFYPEKREFFLEGQGIFGFGGQQARRPPGGGGGEGGSDTPVIFFSRRIGLDDAEVVPIKAGGRLTGRAGKFTLGALNIRTAAAPGADVPATNFSVVRLKRDILRRSNIGVIATHRRDDVAEDGTNSVLGVDANFSFFQNLLINTYYARSRSLDIEGDDASYLGKLHYGSDRFGVDLERLVVGENFHPEIGFVKRDDFKKSFGKLRFSPRPRSLTAVRRFNFEGSLAYYNDGEGRLETRRAQLTFRTEFASGDILTVDYSRKYEFLEDEFEIAEDILLPVGRYSFQDARLSYMFGPQRRMSGYASVGHGTFYSGERTRLGWMGRIEISPRLSVSPQFDINWVDLQEGRFTTRLVRARVNYTLSPRAYVAALIQYNDSNDSLSSNIRFRWEYRPGSDLFVVYTDGRNTLTDGFPSLENRTLVVKLTRLLRF